MMMKKTDNFSRTIKVGRISQKSCVYTSSPDGRQYVKFSLAVNKDNEPTDFFECIAYNAAARFLDRYADVGAKVLILGTDKTSCYKDKKDIQHKTVQVIADSVLDYYSDAAQQILDSVKNIFSCA